MAGRVRWPRDITPVVAVPGSMLVTLACLYLGRFIRFDDLGGNGDSEWGLTWAIAALASVTVALVLAVRSRRGLRVLAWCVFVISAGVFVVALIEPGFRFILHRNDDLLLMVVLTGAFSVAGLMTLKSPPKDRDHLRNDGAPSFEANEGADGSSNRLVPYALTLTVVSTAAFVVGQLLYERWSCDADANDCDLGGVAGVVAGVFAVALCLGVCALVEVWRRQRSGKL